jgi:hypothetical protein
MTQFSAGLAMGIPGYPNPQISAGPELVYLPSFPFRKTFWIFNAIWYSTLEFDVFTSYDSYAGPLADVRINGTIVGQIPPRGYTQTGGELAPVSFQFGNGMLQTIGTWGRTGYNQLEIVPGAAYDWLVAGNWRFHYYQSLPP